MIIAFYIPWFLVTYKAQCNINDKKDLNEREKSIGQTLPCWGLNRYLDQQHATIELEFKQPFNIVKN